MAEVTVQAAHLILADSAESVIGVPPTAYALTLAVMRAIQADRHLAPIVEGTGPRASSVVVRAGDGRRYQIGVSVREVIE